MPAECKATNADECCLLCMPELKHTAVQSRRAMPAAAVQLKARYGLLRSLARSHPNAHASSDTQLNRDAESAEMKLCGGPWCGGALIQTRPLA